MGHPPAAKAAAEADIREHEAEARSAYDQALQNGATEESALLTAMASFGHAFHTVSDGTSPAHVDAKGNPKDWRYWSGMSVALHHMQESQINPQRMISAVTAVRQAFLDTFGTDAFNAATNNNDVIQVCFHGSCQNATINVNYPKK